jgi:hypothetical protein
VQIIVKERHKTTQKVGVLVRYGQVTGNLPNVAHYSVAVIGRNAGTCEFLGGSKEHSQPAPRIRGGDGHGRGSARGRRGCRGCSHTQALGVQCAPGELVADKPSDRCLKSQKRDAASEQGLLRVVASGKAQ